MTRAELRLELLKIVHHGGREARHTIEIVKEYETHFAGMIEDDLSTPAKSSDPVKKTTTARQ